jgi:hypothetical protein
MSSMAGALLCCEGDGRSPPVQWSGARVFSSRQKLTAERNERVSQSEDRKLITPRAFLAAQKTTTSALPVGQSTMRVKANRGQDTWEQERARKVSVCGWGSREGYRAAE